jgi:hypothetical protein
MEVNMNNNSVSVVVVGTLGLIGMMIMGKWMFNEQNECNNEHCQPIQHIVAPQYQTQPNYIDNPQREKESDININIQNPPSHIDNSQRRQESETDININIQNPPTHFHNDNKFWFGYRDGYSNKRPFDNCPEYMSGYKIGIRDRHAGCHDYFDRNCPPGFSLRVPGFRLDIK